MAGAVSRRRGGTLRQWLEHHYGGSFSMPLVTVTELTLGTTTAVKLIRHL